MIATLASLLLEAIGLMLRSIEIALPPPLQQMAPTLAQTQSLRRVSIDTQAMHGGVHMSRLEMVIVRRGREIDTYMVRRVGTVGLRRQFETITAETGVYRRQDRQGAWRWRERSGPPNELHLVALETLTIDVRWTALDDEVINGQTCLCYEALRINGEGNWEQALLWIAKESLRPIEMLSLSQRRGMAIDSTNPPQGESFTLGNMANRIPMFQQISSQVVTWSDWDNPTLSIPSIS